MSNVNASSKTYEIDIGPVFFVSPHPNRAIGLEKNIRDYHVICSHKADILDYIEKEGIKVFCLNDDDIRNTGKLLENKSILDYIKSESKGKTSNIITFKPSPKIEKICNLYNFRNIGNDWRINRKFENKINFVEITNFLGIPNAQSEVVKVGDCGISEKYLKEGSKCVIQLPRGYSGNSTFLIENEENLRTLGEKYAGRMAKIAKFIEGDTYTINGCVGSEEVYVGKIIYQITGLTDFNGNRLGTSGNDYVFPTYLGERSKKEIFEITKTIGCGMKKEGYRGIFGLDFIVGKDGKANLIEINPRLVGSIPVYTKLQLRNGEVPFLGIHIDSFLGGTAVKEVKQTFEAWKIEKEFSASQLILRNVSKNPLIVEKALASGIYKVENDKLAFCEKAYAAERDLGDDQILLQCASSGSVINPDIEYANIETGCGIIKKKKPSAKILKIAGLVMAAVKLSEKNKNL